MCRQSQSIFPGVLIKAILSGSIALAMVFASGCSDSGSPSQNTSVNNVIVSAADISNTGDLANDVVTGSVNSTINTPDTPAEIGNQNSDITPVSNTTSDGLQRSQCSLTAVTANKVEFCFDKNTRTLGSFYSNGDRLWAFALPGEDNTNEIVRLLIVEEQLVIIARLDANTDPATWPYAYEASVFGLDGAFKWTVPVLMTLTDEFGIDSSEQHLSVIESNGELLFSGNLFDSRQQASAIGSFVNRVDTGTGATLVARQWEGLLLANPLPTMDDSLQLVFYGGIGALDSSTLADIQSVPTFTDTNRRAQLDRSIAVFDEIRLFMSGALPVDQPAWTSTESPLTEACSHGGTLQLSTAIVGTSEATQIRTYDYQDCMIGETLYTGNVTISSASNEFNGKYSTKNERSIIFSDFSRVAVRTNGAEYRLEIDGFQSSSEYWTTNPQLVPAGSSRKPTSDINHLNLVRFTNASPVGNMAATDVQHRVLHQFGNTTDDVVESNADWAYEVLRNDTTTGFREKHTMNTTEKQTQDVVTLSVDFEFISDDGSSFTGSGSNNENGTFEYVVQGLNAIQGGFGTMPW